MNEYTDKYDNEIDPCEKIDTKMAKENIRNCT